MLDTTTVVINIETFEIEEIAEDTSKESSQNSVEKLYCWLISQSEDKYPLDNVDNSLLLSLPIILSFRARDGT